MLLFRRKNDSFIIVYAHVMFQNKTISAFSLSIIFLIRLACTDDLRCQIPVSFLSACPVKRGGFRSVIVF